MFNQLESSGLKMGVIQVILVQPIPVGLPPDNWETWPMIQPVEDSLADDSMADSD